MSFVGYIDTCVSSKSRVGSYAPAAQFLPSNISGLQLWVRSDLGVTDDGSGFCSSWADQSGNARDLTEATNKPSIQTNQVNGYSGIRFDGSNDKLTSPSYTQAAPFSIFAIMKIITNTNTKRPLGGSSVSTNGVLVCRGSNTVNMIDDVLGADGPSITNYTTGSYALYKAVFNGTSSVAAKNNGSDQTSGTNMSHSLTAAFTLGSGAGGNFSNVEFAEVCIYDSAISGTNLTNLLGYFQSRYGLW